MASLDPLSFLEPVPGANPCGENLEYDNEFTAIESGAREPDEPGIKDVVAVDTRNWRDVFARSQKLLRKTKDARVAVFLARAGLHVEGLGTYCASIAVIKGFVERFWDGFHPQLEDDGDATMRINAIRELWNPSALKDLRSIPLVSDRALGQFSLNDVLIAKGLQKPKEGATAPSPTHVYKALESIGPELAGLVQTALEDVKLLESLVRQKAGDSYGFDAAPLRDLLFRITQIIKEHSRAGVVAVAAGADGVAADPSGQGAAIGGVPMQMQIVGEVRTREDVVQMLEKIVGYYERHEPSSPVPLLMHRAKRLATMNFLEIMKDLADKGLPQVEAVTGKEQK